MFKISGLKSALRSGKWLKNQDEKDRLLMEISAVEDRILKEILAFAKPVKSKMVDHRATQGDAFLELAAISGIGFDWITSGKYLDEALFQEIYDALNYRPGAFQYSQDKAKVSAAILLIEISWRLNASEYIPYIINAYPPSAKFTGGEVLNQRMNPNLDEETDLNTWFFWQLTKIMHDERILDFLIRILELPAYVTPAGFRTSIPGPGYHAAELLLVIGEERGLIALIPKILNLVPTAVTSFFINAYIYLQPGILYHNATVADKGQLTLLKRQLNKMLQNKDKEIQLKAKYALASLRDDEGLGMIKNIIMDKDGPEVAYAITFLGELGDPRVIPFLIDLLADKKFFRRENAKNALNNLKPFWTVSTFLEALKHDDQRVLEFVVNALGDIGDERLINVLTPLLNDRDRKVRKVAEKAIKKLDN